MKEKQHIYQAALYLRLSSQNLKENADESDSIVNQEALLRAHLKAHQDISIKSVFKDDGWSGVNFDRPGFQRMMQKIYDGEVDCVVVKDLSRLGRNHTETGKYITRVFPAFGVRFIAVNDNVDTADSNSDIDNIIIPFKDLLNDSYSRDISTKIRSAMAIKKANGEIAGAFYPYGYRIDPENNNHYLIDPEAAGVVRKIFSWTFDGMGSTEVARRLTELNYLCPSDYKKKQKGKPIGPKKGAWTIFQIYRILRNDVYTGTLRLEKTTTPNYKVKKVIYVPEEDQHIFRNAHEPIISKELFDLMQDTLSRDCRVHSGTKAGVRNAFVYPLAGYIFCADCGANMVTKTVVTKGHQYRYYVCGENKKNKRVCTPHTVPMEQVNSLVLKTLNTHLKTLLQTEAMMEKKSIETLAQPQIEKIQIKIGQILEEKYRVIQYLEGLEKDRKNGILTQEEYEDLEQTYQRQIDDLEQSAAELEVGKRKAVSQELGNLHWIREYKEKGKLTALTRREVITFIDRVEVVDKDHIRIKFRFGNEYKALLKKWNEDSADDKAREAVD